MKSEILDTRYSILAAVVSGIILAAILFFIPVTYSGSRDISAIESTHGISFSPPFQGGDEEGVMQITEKLAHADIYLKEPVFAKELVLNITFDPKDLESLAVGVREDPFWLSYSDRVEIYRRNIPITNHKSPITETVTVSLTDKLQEADRSIDLMFFALSAEASREGRADTGSGFIIVDEGVNDTAEWELHSLTAEVQPAWPTKPQLKDYIRSILKRERPL